MATDAAGVSVDPRQTGSVLVDAVPTAVCKVGGLIHTFSPAVEDGYVDFGEEGTGEIDDIVDSVVIGSEGVGDMVVGVAAMDDRAGDTDGIGGLASLGGGNFDDIAREGVGRSGSGAGLGPQPCSRSVRCSRILGACRVLRQLLPPRQ